ncbi:tetratricopeptide repeat protein [Noviherbaspirillum sp. ST9]|uniref:tetratricopeptide repeat protein n=1 Tax=Noviherbaspirillum sp. ST9 TaxID=3401606 RepID=UPI003B587CF3
MKRTLIACMLAIPFSCLAADTEWLPQVNVQNADFASGKKAVEAKNWQAAVDAFSRAVKNDPRNADIHNYLGYSYRQIDRMDDAFRHYHEALRLEPSHRGANEYIGWAYLKTNQLSKAEEHLARLEKICGRHCEEVETLSKGIADYKVKH